MDRRRFIRRAGAATVLTTGALAGCSDDGGDGGTDGGDGGSDGGDGGTDGGDGGSDGGDGGSDGGDGGMATPTSSLGSGSLAPYDAWATPAVFNSEPVNAFTVDTQALSETSSTSTPTPSPQGTQGPVDPALGLPLGFLFAATFSGFALAGFGLRQMDSEDGPAQRIHSAGSALVFEGSYDVDSVTSMVGESQASESGTYGGYTLFSTGEEGSVLAVSGDSLITTGSDASDPQAVVEAAVDAAAGNAPAYSADRPAYSDLAGALDSQQVTGLAYSPEGPINAGTPTPTPTPSMGGGGGDLFNIGDFRPDGDVRGYATGLSFDDEQATAQLAFRFTGADQVGDVDALASEVAPSASDASVASSGSLVLITATYTELSGV